MRGIAMIMEAMSHSNNGTFTSYRYRDQMRDLGRIGMLHNEAIFIHLKIGVQY